MNNHRKAVFLDVDGTLYSHTTGNIPESAMYAVNKARENGILLFGCTGRNIQELEGLGIDLAMMDGWITLNGAYCFNDQGIIHSDPIRKEDMELIVAEVKKDPFPILFSAEDRMFINMYDAFVEQDMKKIHSDYPVISSIDDALKEPIYQMCPYVDENRWKTLMKQLNVHAVQWTPFVWDVNSSTCTKANGIAAVCDYYGLSKENTYGFGDAHNDILMMHATGTGICMGNGAEETKQAADYVTGHIDENGLYDAFIHFGLTGEE